MPAWSPTGKRLAFLKQDPNGKGGSIETVALDGSTPSQVFHHNGLAVEYKDGASLLWLSDGRLLYSVYSRTNSSDIWGIQVDPATGKPSGEPIQVTHSDLVMYAALSATLDARRLTYQKAHVRFDIYLLKLKGGGTSMETPTRLTFSESDNEPFAWTHDSKSILFTSDRTGKNQIFKQGQENDSAEPLFS